MNIHPTQLDEIRNVAATVRAELGAAADDQTVQDTVEGETDLMEIVGGLLVERQQCLANAAACDEQAKAFSARAARWVEQADRIKDALGRIRDIFGGNIKHAFGSVVVAMLKSRPQRASDFDPDALPDDLVKVKTLRQADADAIKTAMEKGRNVPGYQWSGPRRSVRVG